MSQAWDDERLLQWILDPGARDPDAEPGADPALRRRLAELEAFLDSCRADLTRERRDEPGLVRAVLARTTREDLSWRGDLRLITGFVRSSLRASLLLRVAAASLLLHLAALPVLAYIVFVAPRPAYEIGWTPWGEAHPPAPFEVEPRQEPDGQLTSPLGEDEPEVREVSPPEGAQSGDDGQRR